MTARLTFIGIALSLACVQAAAAPADHRWKDYYAQGTTGASIWNERDSSLNFYCPLGHIDTTPGIFIEFKAISPKAGERVDVQFVVDGKTFPLEFDEIQFKSQGRPAHKALSSLIDALARSKARNFTVAFPQAGVSETFSLAGAKKVFKSARNFLDGCR